MTFHDKLRRRAAEFNKSKVSRAVGLKPNVISTYIAKTALPRADIAFKIAKALDVPLSWLLDDSQGWPPPENNAQEQIINIPDVDLMREACRRLDNVAASIHAALKEAESTDWKSIIRPALETPLDKPLSPKLERLKRITDLLNEGLERLLSFDASEVMRTDPDGRWNVIELRMEAGSFLCSEDPDLSSFLLYTVLRRLKKAESDGLPPTWRHLDQERESMLAKAIEREKLPAKTKAKKPSKP